MPAWLASPPPLDHQNDRVVALRKAMALCKQAAENCVCAVWGKGGRHATFVGLFPPSLYLVLCTPYPSAQLREEN